MDPGSHYVRWGKTFLSFVGKCRVHPFVTRSNTSDNEMFFHNSGLYTTCPTLWDLHAANSQQGSKFYTITHIQDSDTLMSNAAHKISIEVVAQAQYIQIFKRETPYSSSFQHLTQPCLSITVSFD
jgi:hypothetical protein